ncbi:MAG TPA: YibE/F family protein [Kineosporiaceae bacterium]|nr:YibE/F family protein [Kineosporiaceae bacterium]
MGGHHSHAHVAAGTAESEPFVADRRVIVVLLAILVPILIATAVAAAILAPRGTPPSAQSTVTAAVAGDRVSGVVRSTSAKACDGESSDRLPDGSIPAKATCASVVAHLNSGPDQGKDVTVSIPPQVYRAGISPGDRVDLTRFTSQEADAAASIDQTKPDALPSGNVYAWIDFSRGLPLTALAVLFAVLVIGVARLRGLAAIAGLAIAYLTIIKFMLPALRLGENPVAVAVVGSIAVMTVVLYLAHGVSAKTTTALLGTIFGLALTGAITAWAASAAHLNGLSTDDNYVLSQLTGGLDLSGIIVCGIIVAGLGVLNDVTITQASAIWEIHGHAPHLGVGELFASGMRVGRDHLASTIYTIAFAYAGAALPTLLLIDLYQQPWAQVLTSGQIAEEIVRTLVGSIGLILAIPVTTAVAALIVSSGRRPTTTDSPNRDSPNRDRPVRDSPNRDRPNRPDRARPDRGSWDPDGWDQGRSDPGTPQLLP